MSYRPPPATLAPWQPLWPPPEPAPWRSFALETKDEHPLSAAAAAAAAAAAVAAVAAAAAAAVTAAAVAGLPSAEAQVPTYSTQMSER